MKLPATAIALVALLGAAGTVRPEVLDRVAVTVGNQVITESELVLDLRVAAFLDHRAPVLTPQALREAAGRRVDQVLLFQEAADNFVTLPAADDAKSLVNQVRAEYESEDEFQAELERHEITEHDLARHLLAGLQALTFSDLRFRPGIQVSEQDLRAAYDELFQPAKGSSIAGNETPDNPSFEDSREQLEELVINRRLSEVMDEWLASARQTTRVVYREEVFQ